MATRVEEIMKTPVIPGVDTFQFQTLPDAVPGEPLEEHIPNRDIPTFLVHGEQKIGRTLAKFTLEVPEEIVDPVPGGIGHGWFGTEGSYVPMRHSMASNGKPAFTVEPSRRLDGFAGYHPSHLFHPEKLLSQVACGAWMGIQALKKVEKRGVDTSETDLLGHSMGGRTATIAGERKPDDVRSVLLMAAAGLEPHSVPQFLGKRIPGMFRKELPSAIKEGELKPYLNLAAAEELLYYTFGGGLLTIREGLSIGSCSIRDRVAKLGDTGIKTAMLGFQSDVMIPADKSTQHSGNLVDLAAIHPYVRLGHLAPQTHPHSVRQAVFEILDHLNGTSLSSPGPSTKATVKAHALAA